MYLCAYVMIGHYFEKHRALATGIASCGSGVGTFVFAPLTVYLIKQYTWTGAMWILAGVVLNGVVCGAVFRSIPRPRNEDGTKKKRELIDFGLLKVPAFIVLCTSSFLCMIGRYDGVHVHERGLLMLDFGCQKLLIRPLNILYARITRLSNC